MELNELKKDYSKFEKKYKLPSFDELNENFEIGKIEHDAGALLRAIRKAMMEKVVNSMGFIEMLLNPMNAPRMYHAYIKSMSVEDKKSIDKIYAALAELSIFSLECEVNYSEKAEAELVSKILNAWKSVKPDFTRIFANMKKPNNNTWKKERSYWG